MCGSRVQQAQPAQPAQAVQQQQQSESITTYFDNAPQAKVPGERGGSFWWGVLCFFVPIVGIILGSVWREKYPKRAKVCLWCGIVGIITNIFLWPYI